MLQTPAFLVQPRDGQWACYAASRLLMLARVLGLAAVARSCVDVLTNRTSLASHGLLGIRLLSVHQREARKPVKHGDTCSSEMTRSLNIEWANEATLQLISECQKHVVLWESTSTSSMDAALEITVPEVK